MEGPDVGGSYSLEGRVVLYATNGFFNKFSEAKHTKVVRTKSKPIESRYFQYTTVRIPDAISKFEFRNI